MGSESLDTGPELVEGGDEGWVMDDQFGSTFGDGSDVGVALWVGPVTIPTDIWVIVGAVNTGATLFGVAGAAEGLEGIESFVLMQGVADEVKTDAMVSFETAAMFWGATAVAGVAEASLQLFDLVGG